ncbi:LOW QUALITY PROTEIN: ATP synthase subunit a [Oryza brachyantha]|uniref:LOW QUALITY PROTEIN: ATP synthase subunit a n=1 Tax=Oryza brachyantha TaxID=4533 RepID=UPI001ADAB0DF|nr:LOW QUALITY PROTEIN: ATP synthase subunit a [Oryza brachyantha]
MNANCVVNFKDFIGACRLLFDFTHGNVNLLKWLFPTEKTVPQADIDAFLERFESEQERRFMNFQNNIELLDGAEWSNGDIVISGGGGPVIGSPLDQFFIDPLFGLDIGNFYFSFTNESLSMGKTVGLVLFHIYVVTKKGGGKSVPNAWQPLVELIYDFVLNLVNEQIGGNVKQKFFPRIPVTFTFSLFRNPQGMIPFSFTVTSHFLITKAKHRLYSPMRFPPTEGEIIEISPSPEREPKKDESG